MHYCKRLQCHSLWMEVFFLDSLMAKAIYIYLDFTCSAHVIGHVISCFLSFFSLGVGFIGRNFVQFLVERSLASKIRVVDKVPPATGWLNEAHKVYLLLLLYIFLHSSSSCTLWLICCKFSFFFEVQRTKIIKLYK